MGEMLKKEIHLNIGINGLTGFSPCEFIYFFEKLFLKKYIKILILIKIKWTKRRLLDWFYKNKYIYILFVKKIIYFNAFILLYQNFSIFNFK